MPPACAWLFLLVALSGSSCNAVLGIEQRAAKPAGSGRCDARTAPDTCGLSESGKPMTCFAAWQLGGQDFCAEICDPLVAVEDGFACIGAGARVARCQVSDGTDGADGGAGCASGFECYRADLLSNDGLCLTIPTCRSDADCARDGVHTTCGKTLVASLSMNLLNPDNLFCLKKGCRSMLSDCPSSETCFPTQFDSGGTLGDICVPNCSDGRCPPDFACAKTAAAPGSPPICVPGLPGTRCSEDEDCLLGQCVQTGEGFGLCSPACTSDLECALLNSNSTSDVFTCVEGHCLTARSFFGSNCLTQSDCPSDRRCFDYFPYQADPTFNPGHGDCRKPCDASTPCSPQGGLPHVCLDAQNGGCFPGTFDVPCSSSSECLPGLSCEDVPPSVQAWAHGYAKMCTLPCETDCTSSVFTSVRGFCDQGICLLRGEAGAACQNNDQCLSSRCRLGAAGADGTCAAIAP